MKKIIALFLALMMLTASFVACTTGEGETTTAPVENNGDTTTAPAADETTEAPVVELPYKNAAELAEMIFAAIPEDKQFPGGGAEIVLGTEEGTFTLTDLGLAEEYHAKLDSAAQFRHMMNQNTFSAGIYQFKTAEDAAASVEALKNGINGKQWMCGFPEKLAIITLPGNYVIAMFGMGGLDPDPNFAMDLITPFIDGAKTVVEGVEEKINEPIA